MTKLDLAETQLIDTGQSKLVGLSSEQATLLLEVEGLNELPEPKYPGFLTLFFRQFKSPFIYVLLVASIVSFALGQMVNAWFILAVLSINAIIGSIQEFSAGKAAQALKAMVPVSCRVIRDGHLQSVDSRNIVKGDLVLLASGDKVPADGNIIVANNLMADESLLSGESNEVRKIAVDDSGSEEETLKPEKLSMNNHDSSATRCFAGTTITRGRGWIRITSTGKHTEIGKIANDIAVTEDIKPPLLLRIEAFTIKITLFISIIIGLIFLITLLRGDSFSQIFLLGIALAVSAIPEGLPAAITVALAIGMRRMAKQNVIVRSLLAVESLGSCTYIASDKTGTLTLNEMAVQSLWQFGGKEFDLSKIVLHQDAPQTELAQSELIELLEIGALANEAELYFKNEHWEGEGDQVDLAFLRAYQKVVGSLERLKSQYKQIALLPYESEQSLSASIHQQETVFRLRVKGSVEQLMQRSLLDEAQKQSIIQQNLKYAEQGFRVIAIADKTLEHSTNDFESILNGLSFRGLVGILDPLRIGVDLAVEECREAGIDVGMITGDHPATAEAIAKQLKIFNAKERVISGVEIAELNHSDKLAEIIRRSHTFARVRPLEKKIIVDQLKQQGHFVAVTGDGVNDAPALKSAHVGIAMGQRGTDVARESSDLILTDDNFLSIVKGIVEGRIVYANIRKVVFLLISTGAAEILLFLMSLIAGLPLPLFPIQLLWLNLVTNGVQDVALAFEPAEGDELKKPPRSPDEPLFNKLMIQRVLLNAAYMAALAFTLFFLSLQAGLSEFEARNLTLLLMVCFENVHALNSRSETKSLFRMPLFGNPLLLIGIVVSQSIHILSLYSDFMGNLLQVKPVTLQEWSVLALMALSLVMIDELQKLWHRKRHLPRQ